MVTGNPVPVNLYQTPGDVFANPSQVGAASAVENNVLPVTDPLQGNSIALAQRSFAGGGGGVLTHTLKLEVCPAVAVHDATLM
jgi:hypothetical protein